jgi:hypothetical protein
MRQQILNCACCNSLCYPCIDPNLPSARWFLTVAGIANNDCTDCTSLNGSFTLDPDPDISCRWNSGGDVTCFGQPATTPWILLGPDQAVGMWADQWNLFAIYGMNTDGAGNAIPTYTCPRQGFQCCDSNTFTLNPAGVAKCYGALSSCCANWPATLTITPDPSELPCLRLCGHCLVQPETWICEFHGAAPGCADCTNLNGIFNMHFFPTPGHPCIWNGPTVTSRCGLSVTSWTLGFDTGSGLWFLTGGYNPSNGSGAFVGAKGDGFFNCMDTNTFHIGSVAGGCTGGGTATLTPG